VILATTLRVPRSRSNSPESEDASRGQRTFGRSKRRRFSRARATVQDRFQRGRSLLQADFQIGPLSRGQNLVRALTRSRGCKSFWIFFRRVCWASQAVIPISDRPRLHLLSSRPASGLEQKIDFVVPPASLELSRGHFRAFRSLRPSADGKTWQATRRRDPPFTATLYAAMCSSFHRLKIADARSIA